MDIFEDAFTFPLWDGSTHLGDLNVQIYPFIHCSDHHASWIVNNLKGSVHSDRPWFYQPELRHKYYHLQAQNQALAFATVIGLALRGIR